MAAFASFYQRIIDPGASQRLSSERPLAGLGRSRRNTFLRRLLGASIATFGLTCAGTFNAQAANFTCSWNYATANWTTAADWSNCNGTDPNNSGGNTYDVIISTGDPTLTTSITIGSVTINSPGAWSLSGSGANATLTGTLTTSGDLELHQSVFLSTGGGLSNSGALNLDTNHLEGGSSLAIGGTLNNSTTINVGPGDHTLTASSTVSAAALGQVGTINLDGVTGGAQAALKIAAGPVTITSADDVELHDNALFSLAAGDLTNSGALNLDTSHRDGGSSLTVAGTLTNNTTLNLGPADSSLTANTTATAGGLTNTGTVNLFGNAGNPTIQAAVAVNGQATNSGTVNISTATNVTVSGAGNAYTQTAGSTNLSGGTLAAPNVNITGGKMQGMGTVTGAANISGTGIIEAINLANNSLPAALAINGNYGQSGGTFDALLHGTGIQIDEVNVTNGHTVNLTGGDLEAFGVTFALGQVFEDIMTFQPGELSGTFATILGGGNGMSVDLGNGLTLDVIYDNAGGDISLEVTKTVSVPAPLIGGGVPVFLAVGGILFGAKLLERGKKRRSLGTTRHT